MNQRLLTASRFLVTQGGSQPASGRKRINPDTVIYAEGSKPSPISDSVPSHLGHSNGGAAVAAAAAALPEAHPTTNPANLAPAAHMQHQPSPSRPVHTAAAAALLKQQAAPTAAPDVPRDVTMSEVQAGLVKVNHSTRPNTTGPRLATAIFNSGPAPLPTAASTPPPAAAHQEAPAAKRHKAESGQASGGGSQQAPSASQTTLPLPQTSAATPASKCPLAPASATPHTTQIPHTSLPPITPLAMFGASPSPMPTPLGAEADSRNPHDTTSPAGTSSACTTSAATAAAAVAAALGAIAAATNSGAAAAGPMSSSTDANATATPEARLALQESLQQHEVPELLAVFAHELHLPNPVGDRQASRAACKGCGGCAACSAPAALATNELAAFVEGQTKTLATLIMDLCALGYLAETGGELSVKLCMDIVNMATRKPYQESAVGSKEGTSAPVTADSEDADTSRLWFWELRDPKKMLVDKCTAKLCTLYRKRRKDLAERLTAALALSDALSKALAAEGTKGFDRALAKAIKARVRLEKAASVESVEATVEEGEASLRQGMKGGAQQAAMEEKSRERKEARAAKEQAKNAAKAVKEIEKEAGRVVKVVEKAEKQAAKSGFGNTAALGKSQSVFKVEFLPKGHPEGGDPSSGVSLQAQHHPRALTMPSPLGTSSQQPIDVDVKEEIPSIAVAYNGVAVTPSPRIQFLDESLFQEPKPSGQEVLRIFAETLLSFRAQRAKRTRTPGVPPTWAQNKGYCLDTAKEKYLALVTNSRIQDPYVRGGGSSSSTTAASVQPTLGRCHVSAHSSQHLQQVWEFIHGCGVLRVYIPPSVSGRRPLGLDPVLDYDVMSDEDWEEEVEGESLSQQGDDAEESDGHGRETDEEDDGRIVEDGYLSDDEGMAVGGGVGEELDADGEATMPLPGAQPHPPTHPGSRTLLDPRLQALEAAIDKARKGNRPLILCTLPTMAWDHTCGLDPSVLNLLRGSTLRHDVQITPPLPGDVQIQIQTVLPDPPPAAAAAGLAVNGSAAKGGGQAGAGGRAAAAAAAVANGAAADAAAGPSLHRHSSGGVGGGVEAAGAGGVPAGAVENGVGEGGGGAAEKAAGGTAARVRTKTEFPAAFLESLLAFLGTSPLGNINKEAAQVVSGAIRSPTGYRRCASTTTSTRTAVAGACQGGKVVLVRSASPCARIVASLRNRGLISTNHTGTPPMLTVLVPCDAGPGGLHGDSPPPGTKLAKSTVRNGIQAHATYSSKGKAAGEAGWVLNSSLDHAGPAPAPHPTPATAATASAHPPPQPHAPQGPLPLPLPAAPAPAVGSLQRLLQQHASAAPTGAAVQPPPSTAAASAAGEPEPHTLLQPVLVTGAVPVAHTSPTPAGVAPPAAVRFGAAAAPSTAAHAPPRPQADEPADYNAHGGDGGRCSMELGMQEGGETLHPPALRPPGRAQLGSPRVSHGPALRRRGTPPCTLTHPSGERTSWGGSLKGGCAATAAGGASKRAEVDKARSMELILRLVRQQQQRQQRQQQEQEQAPLPLLQGQPVQQQQQQQQQQGAVTGAPTTATGAGCDPVQDSTRHTPQASTPGGSHGLDTRSLPGHGAAPQPRLDTGSGLPKPGPHPFFQPGKATGSATLTPLSGPPNPCTGDSRGPGVKGGDSSHPTGNPDSHGACGVMPGAVGRCSGSGPMDADDAARTAGAAVTALSALVVESDLSSRLLYFPPGRPTSFADAALASSYWAAVACWLAHGSCQGSAHMSQGLSSLAVYSLRDEAVVGSIPPSLLTALAKTATHPRLPRHVCEDVAQSLANTIVALSRHVVQQSEVCLDATASSSRSRSRRQSRCSQAVAAAEDTPDPSIPQAGSSLHLGLDPQLNGPSGCGAGGTGGSVERDSATDDSADAGRTTLSALMLDPWFADVLQRAAVGVKQDGATPLANHLMHCTRILMQHGQDRQQQLQQQRLQQQRLQQQRQQQDTPPGSHSHPDTPHTANTHSFNQDALAPTSPPDLRSPPVLQPSATPTLEQSGCSASPSSAQQDYAESLSAAAALRRRILSDRDWSTALRRASTWKGSPPPDEQQQQQHQPPNMLTSHAVSCVGALAKDPACAEGISRWPSSYGLTLAARAVGDDVKTPLLLRVAVANAALQAASSSTQAPKASKYAELPELLRDIVKELQNLSQQPNEDLSREAASLLQELRPLPEEQERSESI
ncbi:MAG: hypothetical protein WDW38_006344 [Sanguina aurantia]